jgi:hypothetical protein
MSEPVPDHDRPADDQPTTLLAVAIDESADAAAGTSPVPTVRMPDQPPVPAPDAQLVTCPECGTTAMVSLSHREAADFCRTCDYPLFWTPSQVQYDRSDGGAESLRRLPGTVGRATVASLACPHCAEPNAVTAITCVRCGQLLHPVQPPPPPPEVYVPPPPTPMPVEPEHSVPWWVWALIVIGLAALIVLVVLISTNTIG